MAGSSKLVRLQGGALARLDGVLLMAAQGLQEKELAAFPTLKEVALDPGLARHEAGNAFTANVVAGILLAALVVL